jgi:hypothetical protein
MSYLLDLYHRDMEMEMQRREKEASGDNPWLKKIRAQFNEDINENIVVTGRPGWGKSSLSLDMGEDLKPEWFVDKPEEAIDRFVTFSGGEFGRAIKASPDGAVIIGDEFGQQMHHRQFMSEPNVALSNVLQGFRFKRYICFMNLPGLRYLDADAQGLLTWQAHMKKRGVAEIYAVSHPKFRGEDFHHKFIDTFNFRKPRDALWKAYKAKKIENQDRVFDHAIRLMDDVEGIRDKTDRDIAEEILKAPERFMTDNKYDGTLIMDEYHIGSQRAYFIIKRLKREKA